MDGIRVMDDGAQPVVEKGREAPFKQGNFYVFEVADDVARYWNKMDSGRRSELWKQSGKERKDIRQIVEAFVRKPACVSSLSACDGSVPYLRPETPTSKCQGLKLVGSEAI